MRIEDFDEGEEQEDPFEEAMGNCHGHFDTDGTFICLAAGSEDCDWECPFSRDLGYTLKQIEDRDVAEMLAEEADRKRRISDACEPWFSAAI